MRCKIFPAGILLLLGWLPALAGPAAGPPWSVIVEAGDFDREATVVTFPLQVAGPRPNVIYQGTKLMPLQYPPGATNATFILLGLRKGEKATYRLAREDYRWTESFEVAPFDQAVQVRPLHSTMGQFRNTPLVTNVLLRYQAAPGSFPREDIKELFRRGGYLHPIRTRSGRAVTDDFPPNHLHHHGVWWAWTRTEFEGRKPDFWNMGQGKGRVEFVALDAHGSGSVQGGFTSRHRFVDTTGPAPVPVLNETWEVTVYDADAAQGKAWFFDSVSSQSCASTNALKLPKYLYGGVGMRGPWAWNGASRMQILTSDGETDRVKAHAQRSRWCDLSGLVEGQTAGLAVLGHPSNFRAPQPMRVHPDEPFFCYAPQQLDDMEIQPGKAYVSRYRFVVHDGPIDHTELDRLWNDYAHPPVARVVEEARER